MPIAEKVQERTLEMVREELTKAQAEERQLVGEVQDVAAAAEEAVETGDVKSIRKIATRRAELPLLLAAAVRRRARLALEVCELELQEAESARMEANKAVLPAREAERAARERREECEAIVGDYQSLVHGARDALLRARDSLAAANHLDQDELVKGVRRV